MRHLRHAEWLFICDVLLRCNCPYKYSLLLPLLQSRNQVFSPNASQISYIFLLNDFNQGEFLERQHAPEPGIVLAALCFV
jgi:hypothetical protein